MNKQTVYVPIGSSCPSIVIKETYGDIGARKEENVYVLTEEEMRELLSNAFNAGADRNYHLNHKDDQNGTWVPNSTQYIDNLLK
jgi:hypothetical protein